MKKESKLITGLRYLFLSLVFVIGLVAIIGTGGCGGGSSSGGGGGGGSTSLATGEFTKTAQLESDVDWYRHFNTFTTDRRVQHLYLADEIDGSGYITAIAFRSYITTAAEITCPDLTLKMGHTSLSALTDTFANNVEQGMGSLETVLTNAQVVIPVVSAEDYFEIQLDTPFYYNGIDNLVVDFIRTGVCDGTIILYGDSAFSNGALFSDNLAAAIGSLAVGLNMEFTFEGGVDAIESAASPGVGNSYPFGGSKVQLLYDATVINGSGPITGIAMRTGSSSVTANYSYTYTMRIGHSTLTDLTTDFDGNFSGTPVTVADNAAFNVPAGIPTGSYIWISMLDGPFNYNGTDNLIVEIDVSSSPGTTWWSSISTPNNTRAYGNTGSATATDTDAAQYDISFRFNGGTMDTITAENTVDSTPFNPSANQRQYLYRASELGTRGTITRLAFRINSDSAATDYANFTVILGHTSAVQLTTTFADNMDDATTVFSGIFSIPSGLKEGDWIEIPLASSFTYNGEDNLVVYTRTDGGPGDNNIIGAGPDSLYTSRHMFALDNASPTGSTNNLLVDQRLWLQ